MVRNATFPMYQAAAKRIAKQWGFTPEEGPKVIRDWDGEGRHAIVWEDCAPYNWTFLIDGGRDEEFGFLYPAVTCPAGWYYQPITHYALAIYPVW